jgi:hypothetical protein
MMFKNTVNWGGGFMIQSFSPVRDRNLYGSSSSHIVHANFTTEAGFDLRAEPFAADLRG